LFVLAVVLVFVLVYSPHFSYKYPLHADEYFHLEQSKKILTGEYDFKELHYPFLFQVSLLPLFLIEVVFGISPLFLYQFLPVIYAVIASIFLFLFVFRLTKNFWISLFSMVFFASLPSDVNLMGLWFATPFSLTIPLIFAFLFFFIKAVQDSKKKDIIIASAILFITSFIHASSIAFLFPILLVYFLFNQNKIKKNKNFLFLFLPYLIYVVFAAVFLFFGLGSLSLSYIF
jgi:hypothetical protein